MKASELKVGMRVYHDIKSKVGTVREVDPTGALVRADGDPVDELQYWHAARMSQTSVPPSTPSPYGTTLTPEPRTVFAGGKDDAGKLPMSLLFAGMPNALEGVVKVLQKGAEKYSAHSWRGVLNGKQRYHDALLRHIHDLNKHGLDHINTEDFGLPTIDHALCDLLFLRELVFAEQGGAA